MSLISNIDKIMNKLINNFTFFLKHNNIIYHNQFGFPYNQSTEHVLIALTQEIQDACDNDALACEICLDFQKAFHSVNRDKLE